jgi:hypothetical protein
MRKKIFFFLLFLLTFCSSWAEGIKERFLDEDKLTYKVYFNKVYVGKIIWQYLGKDKINDKEVEVIYVDSNTRILYFLNLKSKEKVFLDTATHLPLRVEREVILFGKKETIQEVYLQDKGIVKIMKINSKSKEKIIHQDTPIHNILALLYFFPKDIELKIGKILKFNLPTQKLKIRVISLRKINTREGKKTVYFLLGRGARKFRLYLDKRTRLPLRLEFPLTIGKIEILKN